MKLQAGKKIGKKMHVRERMKHQCIVLTRGPRLWSKLPLPWRNKPLVQLSSSLCPLSQVPPHTGSYLAKTPPCQSSWPKSHRSYSSFPKLTGMLPPGSVSVGIAPLWSVEWSVRMGAAEWAQSGCGTVLVEF